MKDTIVLAYSGGLDTSVALRWLADEYSADVIALLVDVGQPIDVEHVTERAHKAGAAEVVVVDAKQEFSEQYVLPILQAGALYEGRYPLVSALSRPLIAKHLVAVAREHGATAVAHGCTGKGNDQVRFETAVAALAPDLAVLAPVRDWGMTREQEIAYAARARHRGAGQVRRRVLDRPEPVGPVDRGRPARGSLGGAAGGGVRPDDRGREGAGRAAGRRDRVPARRAGRDRRRGAAVARADPAGRRARRRARRRPAGHDREPAGGHQEPRDLRGAGGRAAAGRVRGRRGAGLRARPGAHQAAARAAVRDAGLQRPLVLAAALCAAGVHGRDNGAGDRHGEGQALPRVVRGGRPQGGVVAVRPRAGDVRGGRRLPARRGGRVHPRLVAPDQDVGGGSSAADTVGV